MSYTTARARMVDRTVADRGVTDVEILRALRTVPRHRFVPSMLADLAYSDQPLPIGLDQTISQPFIVAWMLQLAGVRRGQRVLDVGTGSGYTAAVLAELGCDVYTVEILPGLAERAAKQLAKTGYALHSRTGDGWEGWPEHAPYDVITVGAAPEHVPAALKEQLAPGGRLVLPVGDAWAQQLRLITRTDTGFDDRRDVAVLFVPMTGAGR